MSTPAREDVFTALFNLVPMISWGAAETFIYTSRRVSLWDDLPGQPALCQAEHDEVFAQATRLPFKRTFHAAWVIYHQAGKDKDPLNPPAITNNLILDAVEAAFSPDPSDPGWPAERLTLGGLVHHCFIDGKVFKDPGDLGDQALLIVPITILAP